VIPAVVGMQITGLYKFAAERAKQSLALTATRNDLDTIGQNYGINRRSGAPAVVTVTVAGTVGSTIPISVAWIGNSNAVKYYPEESFEFIAGTGSINLVATEIGDTGNAVSGDTFVLQYPIAGVNSVATYSAMDTDGLETETDDDYRRRILNELRNVGGGGNMADYRRWAEEVSGVAAAYPYSGLEVDELLVQFPGHRTIFIEATTDYSENRVPDSTLLDAVRESINYDPVTGLSRPPLGHTDSTLYLEPILVTPLYVDVVGLVVPDGVLEGDVQDAVEDALESYFNSMRPFILGLDVDIEQNDTITALSVAKIAQAALEYHGAYATEVTVGLEPGTPEEVYILGQGELASLGGVAYA
jgi:hypothetical protein